MFTVWCMLSQSVWGIVDWRPELLPANAGMRSPQGELRIRIPSALAGDLRKRLTLELDGVDVTAMLEMEEDVLIFTPVPPLEPGMHLLRLVEETPEGELLERGSWRFEVRRGNWLREAGARIDADLLLGTQLSRQEQGGGPESIRIQGGARLEGVAADAGWRATAAADLYLLPEESNPVPDGKPLEVGEYLVELDRGEGMLRIGHHDVGANNLILQGFDRRGVSASLPSLSGSVRMIGFAQRSESVVGSDDPLGIGDSENRTGGLMLSFQPFAEEPDRLFLSATLLGGTGSRTGYADWGDSAGMEGSAWGAVADARLLNRRLRLRGEYAATSVNFDPSGQNAGREEDYGYSLLADFTPGSPLVVAGEELAWGLGLEQQRVGTFFRSLGNPGLPTDRSMRRVFTHLEWGRWQVAAGYGVERDNVNYLSFLPVTNIERSWLDLSHSSGWRGRLLGVFDRPGLTFSLRRTRQRSGRLPDGYGGRPADAVSSELQFGASFQPERWEWSVHHLRSQVDDRTEAVVGSRSELTTLELNITVGERIQLFPLLQWSSVEHRAADEQIDGMLLGLAADLAMIPERFNGTLGVSLNREHSSRAPGERGDLVLDAGLNWTLWPPRGYRPGLVLYLGGSIQELAEPEGADRYQRYRLFIGARTTLSPDQRPPAYSAMETWLNEDMDG